MSAGVPGRKPPVTSLVLDTNHGGVPVTICACGVLLFVGNLAWRHIDACPHATSAIDAQEGVL